MIPREKTARHLIASPKHTIIFLAIVAALGVAGVIYRTHLASPSSNGAPDAAASRANVVPMYLSVIFAEWALLRFVWKGIRAKGMTLRDLIGGSWGGARRIATDLLLGAGTWLIFKFAIDIPAARILENQLTRGHAALLSVPHKVDVIDAMLWVVVSATAGFCEEVAFRGYLQRQFRALTGNGAAAVFLQAIVFAFGHAYEGLHAVVVIALFALLLGLVAWWRRSLRAGMIAHAWADIFDNLLANVI